MAIWFYLRFSLRATVKLIRMAWTALTESGLSLTALGGGLALLLVIVPTSIGLFGAARSGVATLRRAVRAA
jgi:hypothetical protein